MRKAIVAVVFGMSAVGLLSCEEAKKTLYVEGYVQFLDVEYSPEGSLARGGAEYYGYCQYDADAQTFEFEVGDDKRIAIDSASETYVKFTGVAGPYVDGVYENAVAKIPKDASEHMRGFGQATLKSGGNEFVFEMMDDLEDCNVSLFAKAVEGEVTQGSGAEFTWYVELDCPNLDGVESGDTNLNGFNGFFYFQGC
jgi:hypothetical protein